MIPQDDPQWTKVYEAVNADPDSLEKWESLINMTETFLAKNPNGASKETARSIYERMLTRFPLLFGYWIRYADLEMRIYGRDDCEAIFEKAVTAFPNSVDIWTKYTDFLLEPIESLQGEAKRRAAVERADKLRGVFERGKKMVGRDFLSHPFWDNYIRFETFIDPNSKELLNGLSELIHYPLHQYARYYEHFSKLATVHNEDIQQQVFSQTQQGTLDRWKFESKITRPYFHVIALEREELENWNEYLTFEEQTGDIEQIVALYERALVSAAMYENMWLRYVQWSSVNKPVAHTSSIYERAAFFLAKKSLKLRFRWSLFEEANGNIPLARSILSKIDEIVQPFGKNLLDAIIARVDLEKRVSAKDALAYIDKELKGKPGRPSEMNHRNAILTFLKADIMWKENSDIPGARKVYESALDSYLFSMPFLINYFKFELVNGDLAKLKSLWTVFNLRAQIPLSTIRDINRQFMEYLSLQATPEALQIYIEVDLETSGPFFTQRLLKRKIAYTDNEAQTNARLKRENGHPGIEIDVSEILQKKNPLDKYQREQESYNV